jgi:type VI protein secretion system component Hcp
MVLKLRREDAKQNIKSYGSVKLNDKFISKYKELE